MRITKEGYVKKLIISFIVLSAFSASMAFADCRAKFKEYCGPNAAEQNGGSRCGGEGFKLIGPALNLISQGVAVAVPGATAATDLAKNVVDQKTDTWQENRRTKKGDILSGDSEAIEKTFRRAIRKSGNKAEAKKEIAKILEEANKTDLFCPTGADGKPRFATIKQIRKIVTRKLKNHDTEAESEEADESKAPEFVAL
jgi:hypothetical protein